ncbi:MAG: exodeoxyribonuclease VII large subunit, partial [Anaerolineaceae bacterium]|nr:exodeoxyribonuclease VII large subunit [Anaerolineaceae bacterium]
MLQADLFAAHPPSALTVTDLTRYIREVLEEDPVLMNVRVTGEVSNLSRPRSGHIYFTLKDAGAALRCVIWRSNAARIPHDLQDGMAMEAHGSIGVYEV